jgi:alkanesulfonate monooxygenase SsuD/methylene tetrahydromethanopterin reductase-like flavin-dependent oxidoreductase (luciferase family)
VTDLADQPQEAQEARMADRSVLFGAGLGAWNGADVARTAEVLELATVADSMGLDLFALADHPYLGDKLDAYATLAFLLGRTSQITGVVTVTNPSRPAPLLARTVTSLSALSGGRVVLGIGAGGMWDHIVKLGVPRLEPGAAVLGMAEAITLVRALSGGGADPVSFSGSVHHVHDLHPAAEPAPPIWTGAVGPKALAVTGRLADGWLPGRGSDWLSALYRESRPVIDEAAAQAGRDASGIVSIFNFGGRITPGPLAATRDDDGRWIGGSPGQWIDELTSAVLDHQAGGFLFRSTDDSPPAVALARWAEEIVPSVRAAIAAA